MPQFRDLLSNWRSGVVTAGDPGRLPAEASPRGLNAWLTDVGPTGASPSTRRGLSVVNTTAISTIYIKGMADYRKVAAGAFTRYHLVVGEDGRFGTIASDPGASGTYTNNASTIFTGATRVDFAFAANLAFIVNAAAARKFNGTDLQNFGIARPSTNASVAAGAAGTPTGTYEVRFTFYNGNTGHESSASDSSSQVTLNAQQLSVSSIDTSADTQVTARRVYVRNVDTMANFYLAGTISDNTTTTFTWNAADTTLTTKAPDTAENDPPPSGITTLAWHRSRMFAADDNTLYYSKAGLPEAFDPDAFERVNPQDGQRITGLRSYGDVLLIFKSRSLYALFGVDPASWQVRLVSADIGCTSHQSIVAVDTTLYWWSEQGPVRWDGIGAKPLLIGQALLSEDTIGPAALAYGEFNDVVAGVMPVQQLVVFAVAEFGKTRNTICLPWSYRLNCWVSSKWDPLGGISALATVIDDTGRPWLYAGSYQGQVFRWWDTDVDGVASGTVTGTFVAGSGSISSITGTGFMTTGSGLVERMVSVVDSSGNLTGRRYITANTATSLTLDSSLTVTNGATYTYHIGGPNFEWDTRWEDSGAPFTQKRFEFAYVQLDASSGKTANIHLFHNARTSSPRVHDVSLTASGVEDTITRRLHFGRVGHNWLVRTICRAASSPITLQGVGVRGLTLSDHIR